MMAERIPDPQLDDARVQTWIEDFLSLALPAGVY
jgi:hypothetical protein